MRNRRVTNRTLATYPRLTHTTRLAATTRLIGNGNYGQRGRDKYAIPLLATYRLKLGSAPLSNWQSGLFQDRGSQGVGCLAPRDAAFRRAESQRFENQTFFPACCVD